MTSSGIPSLIVQKGLAAEQVFLLKAPVMVIGRMAPADIILDHKMVSRQHARITLEGGRFYLEDLNSAERHVCQRSSGQGKSSH